MHNNEFMIVGVVIIIIIIPIAILVQKSNRVLG
jgi:hypothetical protein